MRRRRRVDVASVDADRRRAGELPGDRLVLGLDALERDARLDAACGEHGLEQLEGFWMGRAALPVEKLDLGGTACPARARHVRAPTASTATTASGTTRRTLTRHLGPTRPDSHVACAPGEDTYDVLGLPYTA